MRRSVMILAVTTALQARAEPVSPREVPIDQLRRAGVEIGAGKVRVNGVEGPAFVMTGRKQGARLRDEIKAHYRGEFSVKDVSSEGVDLLLIMDMRGDDCPRCTMPSLETIDAIMANALVVSFLEVPGAGQLAIGSPASVMLQALRRASFAYEGQHLGKLELDWSTANQLSLEVGRSRVVDLGATSKLRPELLETQADAMMAGDGFKTLGPAREVEAGGRRERVWHKGNRVVTLQITPDASGHTSKVSIHEVTIE